MARFEVTCDEQGSSFVAVRCPSCAHARTLPLAAVDVGIDVSCMHCGRTMLLSPDDMDWIRGCAEAIDAPLNPSRSQRARAEREALRSAWLPPDSRLRHRSRLRPYE